MFEKITFINHLGEQLDFGSDGKVFANYNDLRDYSWEYNSNNGKISSFFMGIAEKSIPVLIKCESKEEGYSIANKILEFTDKDVLTMNYGKIIIGEYYIKCYVNGSKKEEYLEDEGYMKATLSIVTDLPRWISERKSSFEVLKKETSTRKRNFDYNYDFNYDFKNVYTVKDLLNESIVESDFKIEIHGYCLNPSIKIAGHEYLVNVEVLEGSTLVIDSLTKKIYMIDAEGNQTNCFNQRNRKSYMLWKKEAC